MAPSRFAPIIFNRMPPIAPTLPLAFIVPVPAMVFPPESCSPVTLSIRPSVYIMPADGADVVDVHGHLHTGHVITVRLEEPLRGRGRGVCDEDISLLLSFA